MATRRASTNSSTKRDRYLRRTYNITEDEYDAMLKHQRYRCGACKKHASECKTRLHVDHDHRTGIVRGLLCYYCNRWVIGRNSSEKIIGAAYYLMDMPAHKVLGPGIRFVPEGRRKRGRTAST